MAEKKEDEKEIRQKSGDKNEKDSIEEKETDGKDMKKIKM